jgi:hypothetical protein
MRYFCSFMLLVLYPFFSSAQTNYKPGYVVTLKGDTLHGFIDYRVWDTNPNFISFKQAATDVKIQKLSTEEIGFFSVDNLESYRKYSGRISMDQTDPNHIINGRDSSFRTADVFLKILQKGKRLTLFEYSDDIKSRFYIAENPAGLPYELDYKTYNNSDAENTSGKTVTESTYMRQLYAIALKNGLLTDALQVDIEHSGYVLSDILKIVSNMNGISKAEYKEKYNEKNISLFASVALSVTRITPFGYYKNSGGKAETSYLPAVSFGLNFFAISNRLIFRIEGMISENQYKSIYIYTGSPYIPVRYSYNQLCFAFTPQVIYNFYTKNDFAVFAGAGLAITFDKYPNATYDLNYENTKVTNASLNLAGFFSTFNTPLLFKAGIKLNKKFGIFVNYFTSTRATQDLYFNLNSSAIQAGLSYTFN